MEDRSAERLEQQHLTLFGNACEKGINEIVIDSRADHITQIEIPVHPE